MIWSRWKGNCWQISWKGEAYGNKRAKTIAEFVIRQWMEEHHFVIECFMLSMNGNRGIIKDETNDTLTVIYDPGTKQVSADY